MVTIITHIFGINWTVGMDAISRKSDLLRCALGSSLDRFVLLRNLPGQLFLLVHLQFCFGLNLTFITFEIELKSFCIVYQQIL